MIFFQWARKSIKDWSDAGLASVMLPLASESVALMLSK
jgi:hypothetical protein